MPRRVPAYEHVAPDPPVAAPPAPPGPFADGAMRVNEACAFAGLSRTQLYERMASGELPYAVVGGRRKLCRAALVRLLRDNEARA